MVNGDCETNPCLYVTVDKNLPYTPRELPTADEISKVKQSVDCTFGLFAYFLLYTGLRRGEALALKWGDIDFENKIIRVNKSVYWVGNVPHIKQPKTASGTRSVILLDNLADKLSAQKVNKKPTDEDILFSNANGQIYHNGNVTRDWSKYQEETGLKITPHQLRHAYATILYEAGIEAKDAQYLLGHADIATTQNVYTHISEQQHNRTAARFNNFIMTGE